MADRLLIAWSLIALLAVSGCAVLWLVLTHQRRQLRRERREERRRDARMASRGAMKD